jgi:hypothetical protein
MPVAQYWSYILCFNLLNALLDIAGIGLQRHDVYGAPQSDTSPRSQHRQDMRRHCILAKANSRDEHLLWHSRRGLHSCAKHPSSHHSSGNARMLRDLQFQGRADVSMPALCTTHRSVALRIRSSTHVSARRARIHRSNAKVSVIRQILFILRLYYLVYQHRAVLGIAVYAAATVVAHFGRIKIAHIAFAAVYALTVVQHAALYIVVHLNKLLSGKYRLKHPDILYHSHAARASAPYIYIFMYMILPCISCLLSIQLIGFARQYPALCSAHRAQLSFISPARIHAASCPKTRRSLIGTIPSVLPAYPLSRAARVHTAPADRGIFHAAHPYRHPCQSCSR